MVERTDCKNPKYPGQNFSKTAWNGFIVPEKTAGMQWIFGKTQVISICKNRAEV